MMFPYKGYKLYMDTLYIGLQQLNFPGTKAILLEKISCVIEKCWFFENDCQHDSKVTLESHFGQILGC